MTSSYPTPDEPDIDQRSSHDAYARSIARQRLEGTYTAEDALADEAADRADEAADRAYDQLDEDVARRLGW